MIRLPFEYVFALNMPAAKVRSRKYLQLSWSA